MITDLELAYLAGIIDGEGCIYVDRFTDKRKTNANPGYVLRLKITMTCKKTIDWIHKTISKEYDCCNIYETKGKEFIQSNRRQTYEFKFAKNLIDFLRKVYPYMITKTKQAELAFEWEKTRFDNCFRGRQGKFLPIPKEILEMKELIYKKFRLANKRGR